MIERPLDRLNYYNGQRLEASDLKLEQEYHIRVRRWVNKSLYKPGIASGLDIRPQEGTRFVIVSPGLALDAEGREILLLEEEPICVPGLPHPAGSDAEVVGPYLTIRYNEETIQEESNGCTPRSNNGSRAAWGGPALVRAKPVFDWRDSLPYASSGEIVLAQVELLPDCSAVHQINTGVRRYVGPASDATVRQYALEGERHVDRNNPVRIYFHVRGRQPNAVSLYLRAERFSTLYYTEIGNHSHGSSVSSGTGPASTVDSHQHPSGTLAASGGSHTNHSMTAFIGGLDIPPQGQPLPSVPAGIPNHILATLPTAGGVVNFPWPSSGDAVVEVGVAIGGGDHSHSLTGSTGTPTNTPASVNLHTHPLNFSVPIAAAGVLSAPGSAQPVPTDYSARNGSPVTYVDNLKIEIDGIPVKDAIISQLKDANPGWLSNSQDKLGDGSSTHPLATDGTGEIKLDFLSGIAFTTGEHLIELSIDGEGNGGRIFYNLYVE